MAIIEINPELKETNKILERLTRAVERFLLEAYNVRLGSCVEPAADPHPELESTVEYHTDTDTLREELKTLAGYAPPENEQDDSGV